jgi:hypothetical protein
VVKSKTYDTDTIGSIAANGGGNNGGAGYLGLVAIANNAADAPNLVAFNNANGLAGFVALTADTIIANGIGGGAAGTAAAPRAFATTGDVHFIAKTGGVIDRIAKAGIAGGSHFVVGAGTEYIHTHGGNRWTFDGGTTANDVEINALAFHNGNLYVGMEGGGVANKGGVVIIQGAAIAAGTAVAPHISTSGKNIKSFAVRG